MAALRSQEPLWPFSSSGWLSWLWAGLFWKESSAHPLLHLLRELSGMRQKFSASSNWSFIWYLHKAAAQIATLSASAQRDPFENRQSNGLSVRVLPSILNSTCSPVFELQDVIIQTPFRAMEASNLPRVSSTYCCAQFLTVSAFRQRWKLTLAQRHKVSSSQIWLEGTQAVTSRVAVNLSSCRSSILMCFEKSFLLLFLCMSKCHD